MVYSPGQSPGSVTCSPSTTVSEPLQASVAVAGAKVGPTSQLNTALDGTFKTGSTTSITSTVWVCWLVNPQPSVAVKVRMRVNSLGQSPLMNVSVMVRDAVLQSSVANTVVRASSSSSSTGQFKV